ncbi:tetratricopeptide repeat protein [Streptomyces griseofuscus]|uniref:tetratricopeptide repeat protein n=1 Tax=Streptomyces griseofuscus TaxID=146922 RepID=UPI0012FEC5F1|nr:tetratricopeptide repeat protein [Streptomyces griseofuscus]
METALSAVLNFLGRYEEGIEAARRALELDPSVTYAWVNLYTGLGRVVKVLVKATR